MRFSKFVFCRIPLNLSQGFFFNKDADTIKMMVKSDYDKSDNEKATCVCVCVQDTRENHLSTARESTTFVCANYPVTIYKRKR